MHDDARVVLTAVALALASVGSLAHAEAVSASNSAGVAPARPKASLPCQAFSHPPEKPHGPRDDVFAFDQLEHYYRVPGEFTHRLNGDEYGFETLSFIITETHPGGGPGLHVHDTEEAHILLEGTAQYRIGDRTFTVSAPYVAKVPAGVAHTFVNVGAQPFKLVAVLASKHPDTRRIGPNPLIPAGANCP